MFLRIAAFAITACLVTTSATAKPLVISFDFSRSEIGIDVSVRGTPLYVLLDTGVDPSTIDLTRAESLGLKIDYGAGGEISGVGNAAHATAYPTTIDGIVVAGRSFAAINAGTADMSAVSARYGRKVDGVFGYSFLKDKTVLVDYPAHTVVFLGQSADAEARVRACRKRWSTPMYLLRDFNWPLIENFRIGAATLTATLDTGSNAYVSLYQNALDLPQVRTVLTNRAAGVSAGLRGPAPLVKYTINAPIGFGPFALPPGQAATLRQVDKSLSAVRANIGNKLFAAMELRMLLDYPGRTMMFFGDCS
jgi:hypothetical protein